MEVISREAARERGLKFFYTGIPCNKGHTGYRYVVGGACKECRSLRHRGVKLPDVPQAETPRAKAKRLGEIYYWTGKPCSRGHLDYRVTSGGSCRSCSQENNQNLRDDSERHQERLKYSRDYYKNNREYKSEYAKMYRKEVFEESGERLIKMRASRAASESKRRFMIRCSSSPHFEEEIGEIYYQAKLLQSKLEQCVVSDDSYDTVVNVDHIVPINNKYICGLHAPQNLRIISARENFQKQATFYPYVEVYI